MDEAVREELIAEMEEYRNSTKFPATLYGQSAKQGFIQGCDGCIKIVREWGVNTDGTE